MSKLVESLQPGDVVEMSSTRLPDVTRFRAAVESVRGDEFSVFSFDIEDRGLSPEDLTFKLTGKDYAIFGRAEAVIAVPLESGGFNQGDRLRATVPDPSGTFLEGVLVAALDGLLYCVTDQGDDFTAATDYLEKVK